MRLVTTDEALLCKAFLNTLSEKALTWFTSLKTNSIDSWYRFDKCEKGDDELFLDYLERFKQIYGNIEGLSQESDELF